MNRLDEIKARLAAASPRPWRFRGIMGAFYVTDERGRIIASDEGVTSSADFALIAHAPTDLALLIEAVERFGRLLVSLDAGTTIGETIATAEQAVRDDLPWLRERGLIP